MSRFSGKFQKYGFRVALKDATLGKEKLPEEFQPSLAFLWIGGIHQGRVLLIEKDGISDHQMGHSESPCLVGQFVDA